jgi:hypothetical protein
MNLLKHWLKTLTNSLLLQLVSKLSWLAFGCTPAGFFGFGFATKPTLAGADIDTGFCV